MHQNAPSPVLNSFGAAARPESATRIRDSSPPLAESVPARKRLKTPRNRTEDDDKKRLRGRPRLDTNDESAADRRRTQIRLAQRAYRQRKDTAITSLEQKVKDLEQANECMSKEFMNFYDFVLSQGFLDKSPEIARRFNATSRKFLSLAHKPIQDDDEGAYSEPSRQGEVGDSVGSRLRGSRRSVEAHSSSLIADPQSGHSNHGEGHSGSLLTHNLDPSQQQYEIITEPTLENASFPVYDMGGQPPFLNDTFAPAPHNPLSAPTSYAFQEPTLGRRLQRLTIEAGFRLVTMKNPPPERFAAVFGFCLLFESRDDIKRRLGFSLNSTRQESLFYWRYPFTNLGGAGLQSFGNNVAVGDVSPVNSSKMAIGNKGSRELYKPQEMTGFSMGPFNPQVETTRERWLDQNMRMLIEGFDGRFLDSDEIDEYLQERGIIIPAHTDFVHAEIDINRFQSAYAPPVGGAGDITHLGMPSSPSSNPQFASGNGYSANPWSEVPSAVTYDASLLNMTLASQGNTFAGASSSTGTQSDSGVGLLEGASQRAWAADSSWGKTKVRIDVSRLLKELVTRAVCLGRTPGVRAKDVDRAVKLATGFMQAPPCQLASPTQGAVA